jgi:penicillin-binding protein 1A
MNNITASIIKNEGLINEVFNRISQLGIDTSNYLRIPAMALGVFDISIYNMVGAMCSFANNGIYIEPTFITKVEDKYGNIIYEPMLKAKQVWNHHTAYTMLQLMKQVTLRGTGARIRYKATDKRPYTGIKQPVAGKTGTTQNQSDGWFMGITPDLVSGVWVGAEDRSVRFKRISDGMGSNMALPIWAYFTKKINSDSTLNISQEDFEVPLDITKDPLDCTEYNLYKNVEEEFNEENELDNIWNDEQEDNW